MSLLADKHRRNPTPTIVALQVPTNGDTARVYVFDNDEKNPQDHMAMARRKDLFHCLCSMFATFSFGIMLGWPAPTYPNLLDPIYTTYPFDPQGNFTIPSNPDAPLPQPFLVTFVQSPLIAGLLMVGVIVATPFSSHPYTIYSIKHGLLITLLAMVLGWFVMWQASNIFHLMISRFIIGLANGYAVGQIKVYIQHSSLAPRSKSLMSKMLNIMMLAGVTCAYVMGIWLDFEGFSIGALVITTAFYILTYFLPLGDLGDSKIQFIERVPERVEPGGYRVGDGILTLFRTPHLKRSTWLLVIVTFIQQFSGAPATIVYSQVLLLNMGLPPPSVPYCAVIYLLCYILAYVLGLFYFCTLSYTKKRALLLFSMVTSILALVLIIMILHLDLRQTHVYIPLVGMCLFIFFYGIGLGSIPPSFVEHLFDPQWRNCAGELQLLCFSLFAIIITKLLQVFIGEFPLEYAFVLYTCIATAGIPFVLLCLPKKPPH